MFPDAGPEEIEPNIEYMHATASPASHRFIWCCLMGFDLRPMLRHVTHPTLVIHSKDDQLYPVQHGKYFAEHIPGAEYLELECSYHLPMFDPNALPDLQDGIEKFITGLPTVRPEESSARIVSTVLFSDIVGSTERQRERPRDGALSRRSAHRHSRGSRGRSHRPRSARRRSPERPRDRVRFDDLGKLADRHIGPSTDIQMR